MNIEVKNGIVMIQMSSNIIVNWSWCVWFGEIWTLFCHHPFPSEDWFCTKRFSHYAS